MVSITDLLLHGVTLDWKAAKLEKSGGCCSIPGVKASGGRLNDSEGEEGEVPGLGGSCEDAVYLEEGRAEVSRLILDLCIMRYL